MPSIAWACNTAELSRGDIRHQAELQSNLIKLSRKSRSLQGTGLWANGEGRVELELNYVFLAGLAAGGACVGGRLECVDREVAWFVPSAPGRTGRAGPGFSCFSLGPSRLCRLLGCGLSTLRYPYSVC